MRDGQVSESAVQWLERCFRSSAWLLCLLIADASGCCINYAPCIPRHSSIHLATDCPCQPHNSQLISWLFYLLGCCCLCSSGAGDSTGEFNSNAIGAMMPRYRLCSVMCPHRWWNEAGCIRWLPTLHPSVLLFSLCPNMSVCLFVTANLGSIFEDVCHFFTSLCHILNIGAFSALAQWFTEDMG